MAKPFGLQKHFGYHGRDEQGVWNDFALIELSERVDFSQYPHIRPVCLPDSSHIDYDGQIATVAGWGHHRVTYEDMSSENVQLIEGIAGRKFSDTLQKLDV